MKVYYLKEHNEWNLHTITRCWGGNNGAPRPEDLGEATVPNNVSVLEIDALVNRKLCDELKRGWMPKPVQDPLAYIRIPPPYFVNDNSEICLQDGTVIPVETDPYKTHISEWRDTRRAAIQAKHEMIADKIANNEEIPEETVTMESLKEELEELKDVVDSLVFRKDLEEWKG